MPGSDILCEFGRVQVLHSDLDHTLRRAIKRMLGISVDDPGYWNETRGMSGALRDRARELIGERCGDDDDTADILNKVIDDAECGTLLRNRVLHSVWMRTPGQEPLLQDRDNATKSQINFSLPTAADLAALCERIDRIQRVLNHVTRKLSSRGG